MPIPKTTVPRSVAEIKKSHADLQAQFFTELNHRRKWLKRKIEFAVADHQKKIQAATRRFIRAAKKEIGEKTENDLIVLDDIQFYYPTYASDECFYTFRGEPLRKQHHSKILIRNDFSIDDSHLQNTIPEHYQKHNRNNPHPRTGEPFNDFDIISVYELAAGKTFTPPDSTEVENFQEELVDSGRLIKKMRGRKTGSLSEKDAAYAKSLYENYQRPSGGDYKKPTREQSEQWASERTRDVNAPHVTNFPDMNDMGKHIAGYGGDLLPAGVENLGTFKK